MSATDQKQTSQPGHELTDASTKGIFLFVLSLSASLIVVVFLARILFESYARTEDRANQTGVRDSPFNAERSVSPSPSLQPSIGHETLPYQDTAAMKLEYDRLAGTYGRQSMADHIVHERMPVEAAMKLLVERGLPHDTATAIPVPQGAAPSLPTPYSDGGRGSPDTGTAARPAGNEGQK